MLPPRYVTASSRAGRQEAIRESAQWYAGLLEDMVRRHPCEWYYFEPFLRGNNIIVYQLKSCIFIALEVWLTTGSYPYLLNHQIA
jgi:hypothetical protein